MPHFNVPSTKVDTKRKNQSHKRKKHRHNHPEAIVGKGEAATSVGPQKSYPEKPLFKKSGSVDISITSPKPKGSLTVSPHKDFLRAQMANSLHDIVNWSQKHGFYNNYDYRWITIAILKKNWDCGLKKLAILLQYYPTISMQIGFDKIPSMKMIRTAINKLPRIVLDKIEDEDLSYLILPQPFIDMAKGMRHCARCSRLYQTPKTRPGTKICNSCFRNVLFYEGQLIRSSNKSEYVLWGNDRTVRLEKPDYIPSDKEIEEPIVREDMRFIFKAIIRIVKSKVDPVFGLPIKKYKQYFTERKVSTELSKAFKNNNQPLSTEAIIDPISEKEWTITDGETKYIVEEDTNEYLNVTLIPIIPICITKWRLFKEISSEESSSKWIGEKLNRLIKETELLGCITFSEKKLVIGPEHLKRIHNLFLDK